MIAKFCISLILALKSRFNLNFKNLYLSANDYRYLERIEFGGIKGHTLSTKVILYIQNIIVLIFKFNSKRSKILRFSLRFQVFISP